MSEHVASASDDPINMRHGTHACALDVFEAAGLEPRAAFEMALEYTCFPFDCNLAARQALDFIERYAAGVVEDNKK